MKLEKVSQDALFCGCIHCGNTNRKGDEENKVAQIFKFSLGEKSMTSFFLCKKCLERLAELIRKYCADIESEES